MKVDYLSCRIIPSGGTKIIAQHVKLLKERGHEARLLTTDPKGKELWGVPVVRVQAYRRDLFRESDLLVGSWLRDVEEASKVQGPVICHLCQGYEPIEFSFRVSQERIPPRYRYDGPLGRFRLLRKKWSFRRRIRKIEKIYRLPTVKIAVSQALKEVLEERYPMPCYLVPNGIDRDLFNPPSISPSFEVPLRLLSVGPMEMVFKGIDDVLDAVRILKQKSVPVELIRVSVSPPTEFEKRSGLVDQYLAGLSEFQMADLYRNTHILLAPSLWEGFGLPALEAMSCGVPCILTHAGSYPTFDAAMDFAYFVPPHSPEAIAQGVIRIREDPGFRERMVERGLEVASRYSLGHMGNTLEQTFRNILERREGHAPFSGKKGEGR